MSHSLSQFHQVLRRRIHARGWNRLHNNVTEISRLKALCYHSSKANKPLVLEKPEKFNPPSHGAKLRSPVSRYLGPPLSSEDVDQQKKKKYPHMMPPEGSFMHWFLHNNVIHLWISLGVLSSLTITVLVTNFKRNSPFADMLPEWHELFFHPVIFCMTVLEVLRLDAARSSAEAAEKRKQRIDDVTKRAAYREAHGLDQHQGFGGWTAKNNPQTLSLVVEVEDPSTIVGSNSSDGQISVKNDKHERKPLRKWLGIW